MNSIPSNLPSNLPVITVRSFDCNSLSNLYRPTEKAYTYSIVFNRSEIASVSFETNEVSEPKSPDSLALKISIDNGILNYLREVQSTTRLLNLIYRKVDKKERTKKIKNHMNNLNFQREDSIKVLTQDYPRTIYRKWKNTDILNGSGAFFLILPPLFLFLLMQNEIMTEKEKKLRIYLSLMGVSPQIYWASWIITSFIFSFIIGILTSFFGWVFGFAFFTSTPFMLSALLYFSFTFALQFLSFFICSISSSSSFSNALSYGIIMMVWVVEIFMSNPIILYRLYDEQNPGWVSFLKFLLILYPPFNYSRIFVDITQKSGFHYDYNQNKWMEGPGFEWKHLTQNFDRSGSIFSEHFCDFDLTIYSFLYLLINILISGLATWYFDNVLEHNRGQSNSFIFFLKSEYWVRRQKTFADFHRFEDSVEREKDVLIKIIDLSKIFESTRFLCFGQTSFLALSNINLSLYKNELFTFLGHNGAGKTTLINILTGVLSSSRGEIFINNIKLSNNPEMIRSIIGVCPQFDILWDQLTAYEHLYLYGNIKRIRNTEILYDLIERKLEEVSLSDSKDQIIKNFSGGMKRRLSMAISVLEDPEIIFLDEPTTGMDPESKREVWKLIQSYKKDRCVILTTQLMDEADILSDRIGILVEGELKIVDSPLALKSNFGNKYKLKIVPKANFIGNIPYFLKNIFGNFEILKEIEGSFIILLNGDKEKEMGRCIEIMEKNADQVGIKDWSFSMTTLEEVFMKVNEIKKKRIE